MLENSIDLVWIALAFAILWISIFVGWGAYYLAMILRDVSRVTASVRKKMAIIDQILETIKKKVDTTANYLPPLLEGITKLVGHFKEKKVKESKDKKKK